MDICLSAFIQGSICRHMCVLPNHQFYFYILAVSSALLCVYILCNLYNLVSRHVVDSRYGYSRYVDI